MVLLVKIKAHPDVAVPSKHCNTCKPPTIFPFSMKSAQLFSERNNQTANRIKCGKYDAGTDATHGDLPANVAINLAMS